MASTPCETVDLPPCQPQIVQHPLRSLSTSLSWVFLNMLYLKYLTEHSWEKWSASRLHRFKQTVCNQLTVTWQKLKVNVFLGAVLSAVLSVCLSLWAPPCFSHAWDIRVLGFVLPWSASRLLSGLALPHMRWEQESILPHIYRTLHRAKPSHAHGLWWTPGLWRRLEDPSPNVNLWRKKENPYFLSLCRSPRHPRSYHSPPFPPRRMRSRFTGGVEGSALPRHAGGGAIATSVRGAGEDGGRRRAGRPGGPRSLPAAALRLGPGGPRAGGLRWAGRGGRAGRL